MYLFHVCFDCLVRDCVWVGVDVCCVIVVVEYGLLLLADAGWLLGEFVQWMLWVLCFLSEL